MMRLYLWVSCVALWLATAHAAIDLEKMLSPRFQFGSYFNETMNDRGRVFVSNGWHEEGWDYEINSGAIGQIDLTTGRLMPETNFSTGFKENGPGFIYPQLKSMAFHPETGLLYAISRFQYGHPIELGQKGLLVEINTLTHEVTPIVNVTLPGLSENGGMTSLTFVPRDDGDYNLISVLIGNLYNFDGRGHKFFCERPQIVFFNITEKSFKIDNTTCAGARVDGSWKAMGLTWWPRKNYILGKTHQMFFKFESNHTNPGRKAPTKYNIRYRDFYASDITAFETDPRSFFIQDHWWAGRYLSAVPHYYKYFNSYTGHMISGNIVDYYEWRVKEPNFYDWKVGRPFAWFHSNIFLSLVIDYNDHEFMESYMALFQLGHDDPGITEAQEENVIFQIAKNQTHAANIQAIAVLHTPDMDFTATDVAGNQHLVVENWRWAQDVPNMVSEFEVLFLTENYGKYRQFRLEATVSGLHAEDWRIDGIVNGIGEDMTVGKAEYNVPLNLFIEQTCNNPLPPKTSLAVTLEMWYGEMMTSFMYEVQFEDLPDECKCRDWNSTKLNYYEQGMLTGTVDNEQLGLSLTTGFSHDFDNNNRYDVITTNPASDVGGTRAAAGEVTVYFSQYGQNVCLYNTSYLEEREWQLHIYGNSGNGIGFDADGVGDFNGDGFDDLLIGAPFMNSGKGQAFLIWGTNNFPATIDAADVNGQDGVYFVGPDFNDFAGHSVSAAGDMDDDNLDDLIIGLPGGDGLNNQDTDTGEVYLVFGTRNGVPVVNNLFLLGIDTSPLRGIVIYGLHAGAEFGYAVTIAGDPDDDGIQDILIGSPGMVGPGDDRGTSSGGAVIIFGRPQNMYNDSYLVLEYGRIWGKNTTNATIFYGPGESKNTYNTTRLGSRVWGVSDYDYDGKTDFIIAGPYDPDPSMQTMATSPNGNNPSTLYLVMGKGSEYWPRQQELSDLAGAKKKSKFDSDVNVGSQLLFNNPVSDVAGIGDINGDGFSELIFGQPYAGTTEDLDKPGVAILLYGNAGVPKQWNISDPGSSSSTALHGTSSNERFGYALTGAVNFDVSANADFMISAPQHSSDGFTSNGRLQRAFGVDGCKPLPPYDASIGNSTCSDMPSAAFEACLFTCEEGYEFKSGVDTVSCQSFDKNWNLNRPICTDINDCLPTNPCQHNSVCKDNGINSFVCDCGTTGYKGELCDVDVDDCFVWDETFETALGPRCAHADSCIDTGPNSFECNCTEGWAGDQCDQDYDDCIQKPCQHGKCHDTGLNSWWCNCANTGYKGVQCELDADDCNKTNIVPVYGEFQQQYYVSYTETVTYGEDGEEIITVNEIKTPVQEVVFVNGIAVVRDVWYYPVIDEIITYVSPCLNGGQCTDTGTRTYDCNCEGTGYGGNDCQIDLDDCALYRPCKHRAFCQDTGANSYLCTCIEGSGWTGVNCTDDIDDCISMPCFNGGTCHDTGKNLFECDCNATGYAGKECEDFDACSLGLCLNGGVCTDMYGDAITVGDGFVCECEGTGYNGTTCQLDIYDCYETWPALCPRAGTCSDAGANAYQCETEITFSFEDWNTILYPFFETNTTDEGFLNNLPGIIVDETEWVQSVSESWTRDQVLSLVRVDDYKAGSDGWYDVTLKFRDPYDSTTYEYYHPDLNPNWLEKRYNYTVWADQFIYHAKTALNSNGTDLGRAFGCYYDCDANATSSSIIPQYEWERGCEWVCGSGVNVWGSHISYADKQNAHLCVDKDFKVVDCNYEEEDPELMDSPFAMVFLGLAVFLFLLLGTYGSYRFLHRNNKVISLEEEFKDLHDLEQATLMEEKPKKHKKRKKKHKK